MLPLEMADENSDWEEETLVLVDLQGIIYGDWAENVPTSCKIIGIDTENPLLQMDRYTFTGEYKDAIGTDLIFEKIEKRDEGQNEDADENDAGREKTHDLKFKHKCCKHLNMKRAFLKKKHKQLTDEEESQGDVDTDAKTSEPMQTESQENEPDQT